MVTENRENVNNAAAVDGGVNNETLVGNAATMLEALIKADAALTLITRSAWFIDANFGETIEVMVAGKAIQTALAAPPRNCDRFATVKDAAIAFARERQDAPQPCPDFTFSAWLFAPATEKEGGEK